MSDDILPWSVTNVQEEHCGWQGCSKVAAYVAIMSNPCAHRWAFCIEHRDATDTAQEGYAKEEGQWQCPVGEWHRVGLVLRWERARG